LVLVLGGLIVALHLGGALVGRPLIRSLHLGPALNYARGSIDLLRPVVVGFNATGTPTAQELPLWQAATGLVFKAAGSTWHGWANLVSLLLFTAGLWPFFRLARRYVGERAAWWSTGFLLAQPLIVFQAGNAGADSLCLTLTLWFLFCADRMIQTGKVWWWLPTAVFAVLSAVSKLPFFMAAGLCSVFMLWLKGGKDRRTWVLLAAAGVLAAGALAVWTRYTDSLAAQAEYPYAELRLSQSPHIVQWYFGDLKSRLAPGPWIKGGWRFLHATVGSLPMVALLAAALLRSGNRLPKLWLLATFLTTLTFSNLVLVHYHYFLMCCPAVAMLCGATLARWEDFWTGEIPRAWLRMGLAGAVLVFTAIDGLIASKVANDYDYFPQEAAAVIRQHTKPDDKLIIYGEGQWGGEVLIPAGRQGLSVLSLDDPHGMPTVKGLRTLLNNEGDLRRLKDLGYNKLVLLSESPVRFAVAAVNPGSKRKRIYYPASVSEKVDAWPVVYRSEDILIKEIP
jgi:hypothetical protein